MQLSCEFHSSVVKIIHVEKSAHFCILPIVIVYSLKNKLTVRNSKHENRTTAKTIVNKSSDVTFV